MKMTSCAAKQCFNNTRKKNKIHGITYHSFPKDEFRRQKWLVVVRKQRQDPDWTPTVHSRLCSTHFKSEDVYTTSKGLKRISAGAVPYFQEAMNYVIYSSKPGSPNSLQNVNVSDMESIFDTPRKAFLKSKVRKMSFDKKKLFKENKNLKRKNKRLEERCKSLKETMIKMKKDLNVPEDQFQELCVKAEAADLFARISKQKKRRKNIRMKFSPPLRKFALTLNFYSPAGYKYVRKVFEDALPHPRTLGKWYENLKAEPGFTAEAFEVLKNKKSSTDKNIYCTLVVDEMAIRQQTVWNGRKTLGLVNYGIGGLDVDRVASQAFVMMLVCLDENWKLPVGYFFVDGLTAETKSTLIKICLTKCWEVGVNVVALTFDGCPSNVNAANLLGCNLNNVENLKTTFKHPSCNMDVAVFLDPCHMVKLVRNTFESKRMFFDHENREVKWEFLVNLLKLQSSETLTFANKLTPKHIDFRNQIMKVKLATQLLSRSVADALRLCEQLLSSTRFLNTEATVQFIEKFNNLFDVMNSRKRERFGFKKPLCAENKEKVFEFLNEMKDYICALKFLNKNRRITRRKVTMNITKKNVTQSASKTGFVGFLICIESLKYLYSTLVETGLLKYISMYRLSQDHLELFFGIIRRQGGYNNNPNVRQFQGIYRKVLGHLELRSSLSGNCIPLDNFPILTCSSAIENINRTVGRSAQDLVNAGEDFSVADIYGSESFKKHKVTRGGSYIRVRDVNKSKCHVSDTTAENNVEILSNILNDQSNLSISAEQIIGYIAGWVARALIKTIKCEICVTELITNEKLSFHKLINLKDMGGLCYPSYDLFKICFKSETAIKMFFRENKTQHFLCVKQILRLKLNVIQSFLNSDILSTLEIHSLDQPVTFNHRIQLLKAIVDKYCDVRVHYFHKIDPAISSTTKRQKRNKLSLFEGI